MARTTERTMDGWMDGCCTELFKERWMDGWMAEMKK